MIEGEDRTCFDFSILLFGVFVILFVLLLVVIRISSWGTFIGIRILIPTQLKRQRYPSISMLLINYNQHLRATRPEALNEPRDLRIIKSARRIQCASKIKSP
jgi:hypothetical protein